MTVKEQIKNALTMSWAKIKSLCVLNSNVVNSTSGTSTTYPLSAAAGADLQNQINTLNSTLDAMGFSKTEQCVGKWVDGSPLYQTTVEFRNTAFSDGVTLQHGISGIGVVRNVFGVFMDGTVCNPFPVVDSRGILITVRANHNIVQFVGNVSYFASSDRKLYITLQYTK